MEIRKNAVKFREKSNKNKNFVQKSFFSQFQTDMKDRTVVYQAAKLKQQILYKNKRIADLEKDCERARRRQSTDEQQFFKLYNFFAEVCTILISEIEK